MRRRGRLVFRTLFTSDATLFTSRGTSNFARQKAMFAPTLNRCDVEYTASLPSLKIR
jgi:hypothetical protein